VLRAFCRSNPKTVVLISPAIKKNVHPASGISFSNVERTFVTVAHPLECGSLCNRRELGNPAPSSMNILPVAIVSVMV
jgi:hypothetical protein